MFYDSDKKEEEKKAQLVGDEGSLLFLLLFLREYESFFNLIKSVKSHTMNSFPVGWTETMFPCCIKKKYIYIY